MHEVRIQRRAEKQLSKLSNDGFEKCMRAIEALADDPYTGARKMQGEFAGWYRKSVSGEYRVAYTIEDGDVHVVEVVWVGTRQNAPWDR